MPRKNNPQGPKRKPLTPEVKLKIAEGVKATNRRKKLGSIPNTKREFYSPQDFIYDDTTLTDSIDFLAERIEGLNFTLMGLEASITHSNENAERIAESIAFLGIQVSDLNENHYSVNQESSITDVIAALVFTIRRQNNMWEKITGLKQEDYDTSDEDND